MSVRYQVNILYFSSLHARAVHIHLPVDEHTLIAKWKINIIKAIRLIDYRHLYITIQVLWHQIYYTYHLLQSKNLVSPTVKSSLPALHVISTIVLM